MLEKVEETGEERIVKRKNPPAFMPHTPEAFSLGPVEFVRKDLQADKRGADQTGDSPGE